MYSNIIEKTTAKSNATKCSPKVKTKATAGSSVLPDTTNYNATGYRA